MRNEDRLVNILIVTLCLFSLGILLYILIGQIFFIFAPNDQFLDHRLHDSLYIAYLYLLSLLCGFAGTFLSIYSGILTWTPLSSIIKRERLIYVLIGFLLSNLFLHWLDTGIMGSISLLICLWILTNTLPTLVNFYSINISRVFQAKPELDYSNINKSYEVKNLNYFAVIFASLSLAVYTSYIIIGIFGSYTSGSVQDEYKHMTSLHITSAMPHTTTQAEKIELEGYNFGWRTDDDRFKVMSNNGEMLVQIWNDTHIEFEFPLSVSEGTKTLWIERPIDSSDKKSPIIKSNQISIIIVSRFEFYPAHGDPKHVRGFKRVKRFLNKPIQIVVDYLL